MSKKNPVVTATNAKQIKHTFKFICENLDVDWLMVNICINLREFVDKLFVSKCTFDRLNYIEWLNDL